MILDTADWMYNKFEDCGVDFIVNCGDTLDSSVVKAEEISALNDFYSKSHGIKEYHIIGNHELNDSNKNFYSTYILGQLDFIELIDKPKRIEFDDFSVAFLPYDKTENISYEELKKISADYLFSHIDIKGSALRGSYIMDTGVEPEFLADNFKMTINGHLHTPEIIETSKNVVRNIGSVSSISFVDSNSYIPSICILDTATGKIKRCNNPHSILFRKYTVKTVSDLMAKIRESDSNYRYVVNVVCPYEIHNDVKEILNSNPNIITNRVIVDMSDYKCDNPSNNNVSVEDLTSLDIELEFMKFLKKSGIDSANLSRYESVLSIEV